MKSNNSDHNKFSTKLADKTRFYIKYIFLWTTIKYQDKKVQHKKYSLTGVATNLCTCCWHKPCLQGRCCRCGSRWRTWGCRRPRHCDSHHRVDTRACRHHSAHHTARCWDNQRRTSTLSGRRRRDKWLRTGSHGSQSRAGRVRVHMPPVQVMVRSE